MIECNANEAGRFLQPATDAGAGSGALRCWLNDVMMLLAITGSLDLLDFNLIDLEFGISMKDQMRMKLKEELE